MSRSVIAAVLLLALCGAAAFAQAGEDQQLWQRLGLNEGQVEQARAIFQRTEKIIRDARAEIDVLKAELRRLLLREPVDMAQVEKQLRAGLEWEYRLRLAQISRQVELRRLLGDEAYARLTRELRERRRGDKEGEFGGEGSGRNGGPRR